MWVCEKTGTSTSLSEPPSRAHQSTSAEWHWRHACSVSSQRGKSSFWNSSMTQKPMKIIFLLINFKKSILFFVLSIIFHKFAHVNHVRNLIGWSMGAPPVAVRTCRSPQRAGRAAHEERLDCGEHIYDEGVYLTLCSWHLKTSQTFNPVRNVATVDVHRCVITSRRYTLLYIRYAKDAIYIQAWASALLVQLDWAMRRPSDVGRVTVRLPRFLYTPLSEERLL